MGEENEGPQRAERRATRESLRGFLFFAAAALALAALAGLARREPAPLHEGLSFSRPVYDRTGRLRGLLPSADGRYRLWVPLAEVSPLLVEATLVQPGLGGGGFFCPYALSLARLEHGDGPRGLLAALRLQSLYTKAELVEAYLNRAPYGERISGVGAASVLYFGKNPDQLNLSEALTLGALPFFPVPPPVPPRPAPARRAGGFNRARS